MPRDVHYGTDSPIDRLVLFCWDYIEDVNSVTAIYRNAPVIDCWSSVMIGIDY